MSFINDLKNISRKIDHGHLEQEASGILRYLVSEENRLLWGREYLSIDDFLRDLINELDENGNHSVDQIKEGFKRRLGGQGFNLIPSNNKGACHSFLLAISRGNFGEGMNTVTGKIGFKGLMLSVFSTWFSCIKQNRETLILTADWNQKQFDLLFKPVVESYCKNHNKKAYFILVSDTSASLVFSI